MKVKIDFRNAMVRKTLFRGIFAASEAEKRALMKRGSVDVVLMKGVDPEDMQAPSGQKAA